MYVHIQPARHTVHIAGTVAQFIMLRIGAFMGWDVAGVCEGVRRIANTMPHYPSEYAEIEAAFRRVRGDVDALRSYAYDFKEGLVEARTTVREIAKHVDIMISYCIDERSTDQMRNFLKHLMKVCATYYDKTARCKKNVKSKAAELEAELNRVYTG